MHGKTWLLLAMVLLLAIGMGCGGGSGSGGGGSASDTLVGTWNMASSSGGTWPTQITFDANGTGTALPTALFGSFTWTRSGTTITLTTGGGPVTMSNVPTTVGNTLTVADSSGRTATYNRA